MKKKFVFVSLVLALLFTLLLVFTACIGKKGNVIEDSISEMVENVLVSENDDFKILVSYGKIETPYADDGVCKNMSTFIKLDLQPKNTNADYQNISYRLFNGSEASEGVVLKGILKNNFSVTVRDYEIKDLADFKMFIKIDDSEQVEVELTPVLTGDMMRSAEAFELAKLELKDLFNEATSDDGFNGEIRVKLITQSSLNDGTYYWYVKVITADKASAAVLIDISTKSVLVKRV